MDKEKVRKYVASERGAIDALNFVCHFAIDNKLSIEIFNPEVQAQIFQWWNNIFFEITNLKEAFTANRLGMSQKIFAVLDGKPLCPTTFAEEGIPLIISLQTDVNYIGQTAVTINSIKDNTPEKKVIIIWEVGLSEPIKTWLQNFSDEKTLIITEEVDKKWLEKAKEFEAGYGNFPALRIFYPEMMSELASKCKEVINEFGMGSGILYFLHLDTDLITVKNLKEIWDKLPFGISGATTSFHYPDRWNDYATLVTGLELEGVNINPDPITRTLTSAGVCVYRTESFISETAKDIKEQRRRRNEQRQQAIKDIIFEVTKDVDFKLSPKYAKVMEYFSLCCSGEDGLKKANEFLLEQDALVKNVVEGINGFAESEKLTFSYISLLLKDQKIRENPTEEETMMDLPGVFGFLSYSCNPSLCWLFPKLALEYIPLGRLRECLERRPFLIDSLCDTWENIKVLHFDMCVKPWNFTWHTDDLGAIFINLRYAEEVRKTDVYLRERLERGERGKVENPKEWGDFVSRFEKYFSSAPENLEKAFKEIDVRPYLEFAKEGKTVIAKDFENALKDLKKGMPTSVILKKYNFPGKTEDEVKATFKSEKEKLFLGIGLRPETAKELASE